jgi:hypothetical protein
MPGLTEDLCAVFQRLQLEHCVTCDNFMGIGGTADHDNWTGATFVHSLMSTVAIRSGYDSCAPYIVLVYLLFCSSGDDHIICVKCN